MTADDLHRFARLGVRLVNSNKGGVIVHNGVESPLVLKVKAKQSLDPIFVVLKEWWLKSRRGFLPRGRWYALISTSFVCSQC